MHALVQRTVAMLQTSARAIEGEWQRQPLALRRPRNVGEICYSCLVLHVITEPDHRPVWPMNPEMRPLDNWPPRVEGFREYARRVEDYIDAEFDFEFGRMAAE